jgi:SHS2 domain-containing protein
VGTFEIIGEGTGTDISFTAEAETLSKLLEACARATLSMMTDTTRVKPGERHNITVHANALDDLLVDWLSELIFLRDSESFLAARFRVRCPEVPSYHLQALVEGEPIDRRRHEMKADIKTATYHELEIGKVGDVWRARVSLEV